MCTSKSFLGEGPWCTHVHQVPASDGAEDDGNIDNGGHSDL